jgi:hypothetical protein
MANPTTNYGWVLPTSTDLVTDLPADFDVALQGVDTTTKALNPSTTLGDIEYRSSTANTNTRLGIGSTGNVLTVSGGVPAWGTISASPTSATNFVTTSQSTTSTSFVGLTTAQTITMTTGTKVLVLLTCFYDNDAANGFGRMSVAVSGATTRSSSNNDAKMGSDYNTSGEPSVETTHVYLTCTAGSNTFTMQFASDGGTSRFENRRMTVIDLGS